MTSQLPLMVFSDLDGTLIDHDTYDWSPAAEALAALKNVGAGVVLASSKTAWEIEVLRVDMGLEAWPAIVENGAGLLAAHGRPGADVSQYQTVRRVLDDLPCELRKSFVGFADMDPDEVSRSTGLPRSGAMLAQRRAFSEPGIWRGSEADKAAFLEHLARHGIMAQQGGRFLTLSLGATKADQVVRLREEFRPQTTIALGDAPNDTRMIEACDYGVVIANPSRAPLPPLTGEAEGRIVRTTGSGPAAWNAAVMDFLARLSLN